MKNSSIYPGYQWKKTLGMGTYSTVQLVKRIEDRKCFALKQVTFDKISQIQKNAALNQIRILASINSPFIIKFQKAFYLNEISSVCLLMEYAEGGDLETHIHKYSKNSDMKNGLPEQFIWKILVHILEALKILHQNKIIHRDLKPSNILFADNIAKVGDFNASKIIDSNQCKDKVGTPYYTAPEIWKGEFYSNSCDIWSLGCIIYQMCALNPPFKCPNIPELFVKILKGRYQTLPPNYSQDLRTLIRMCLTLEPDQRPSASQLLNHPIIQKYYNIFVGKNQCISKVNLVKPIKYPRINIFLNDMLAKINKITEPQDDSQDQLPQIQLKTIKKLIQFQQSSPKQFRKTGLSLKKNKRIAFQSQKIVETKKSITQNYLKNSQSQANSSLLIKQKKYVKGINSKTKSIDQKKQPSSNQFEQEDKQLIRLSQIQQINKKVLSEKNLKGRFRVKSCRKLLKDKENVHF